MYLKHVSIPKFWDPKCALSLDVPQTCFNPKILGSQMCTFTWCTSNMFQSQNFGIPNVHFHLIYLKHGSIPKFWDSKCALSLDVPQTWFNPKISGSQMCTFTWCTSNMVQSQNFRIPNVHFHLMYLKHGSIPKFWDPKCALLLDVPQTWFNPKILGSQMCTFTWCISNMVQSQNFGIPKVHFHLMYLKHGSIPKFWDPKCALSLDVPQICFSNWPDDDSLSRNMSPF